MQENINSILPEIENKIFTVRGLSVMLDSDLALLYGVETKRINEAVKRNINRFPEWFMFQLTYTEWENLRFQIGTSSNEGENASRSQIATLENQKGKHRKFLPFAFTEQGVAMLSAVLKSETAVKVSIQIMAAFVSLRKLHYQSAGLYQRIEVVEKKQIEADNHFNKIFSALEKRDTIPRGKKISWQPLYL